MRAQDAMRLEELLAIEGWQSREVSLDVAKLGSQGRLVYQVPGEGDRWVWSLYPTAANHTLLLALKHLARMPLEVVQMWRFDNPLAQSTVTKAEIDPAPTIASRCTWNPALTNLGPGNTVVAVWPTASGNASFDPINTNFRARLVLVLPPKQ